MSVIALDISDEATYNRIVDAYAAVTNYNEADGLSKLEHLENGLLEFLKSHVRIVEAETARQAAFVRIDQEIVLTKHEKVDEVGPVEPVILAEPAQPEPEQPVEVVDDGQPQ